MKPDDGVVLDEEVVRRRLRDPARREPDYDDAPLKGDALGRAIVDIPTDRIENDVGAATSREFLDLFGEVLRLVVDRIVGAKLQADRGLLVRPCGGDDH